MIRPVTALGAWGGPVPYSFAYGEPLMITMLFPLKLAGDTPTDFSLVYPSQQCQVGDQGVLVSVQVLDSDGDPVSLRTATAMRLLLVRPSGATVAATATFSTNGFDGKMGFTSTAVVPAGTGLDEPGVWAVQGKFTIAGVTQFTAVAAFAVIPNLGV